MHLATPIIPDNEREPIESVMPRRRLKRVQFFGWMLRAMALVEQQYIIKNKANPRAYPDEKTLEEWIDSSLAEMKVRMMTGLRTRA